MNKSELTNFLDSGAILQVASDQYKLIWGPFKAEPLDLALVSGEKTIIYKPDFWDFTDENLRPAQALSGTGEVTCDRQQLLEILIQQEPVDFQIKWHEVTETEFVRQFNWSQDQFKAKALVKTVPIISQQGTVSFSKRNLVASIIAILSENHYGSTYGFWQGAEGFLGHTPELILEWNGREQSIKTMALAGTLPAGESNARAIRNDPKILDEHQIVVDDMVHVLQKVDTNKKVEVDDLKVLELKYLYHLQTPIQISEVTADEVKKYVQALHPTAALGLFPRVAGGYTEFKKFSIQRQRQNFAAPFAFFTNNQVKAIAAIRSFYFDSKGVKIISGCGVTAGSVLQEELKELENKRKSVKRMMGMNL